MEKPKIFSIKDLPEIVKASVTKIWGDGVIPENISSIVYTYFEGIYTLHELTADLFIHECTHYIQQGGGQDKKKADAWWVKYANDADFRYSQEIEAYREQYKFILKHRNKAVAFNAAKKFAMDLSSPMYGNICTFMGALSDIIRK